MIGAWIQSKVDREVRRIIGSARFRAGDCGLCGGAVFASFNWNGNSGWNVESGTWWLRPFCSRCQATTSFLAKFEMVDRRKEKRKNP